jgi:hypothetical protein
MDRKETPMARRLRFALGLLAALPAAAPAVAQPSGPIVVRALVGRNGRVLADTMGTPYEVPFPPAAVLTAVLAVYDELQIPAEVVDSARLDVGTQSFLRRRSFAGRRMSAWVDCGSGFTGPRADSYRIDLALVSFIRPASGGTSSLRSVLLGTALNVTEGGRPEVACNSTGELERRIHEMVLARLRH